MNFDKMGLLLTVLLVAVIITIIITLLFNSLQDQYNYDLKKNEMVDII